MGKGAQMMQGSSAVHHLSSALLAGVEGDGEVKRKCYISVKNTGKGV